MTSATDTASRTDTPQVMDKWRRRGLQTFLLVTALVWLMPLLWAVYTSLRPFSETAERGYVSIGGTPDVDTHRLVFEDVPVEPSLFTMGQVTVDLGQKVFDNWSTSDGPYWDDDEIAGGDYVSWDGEGTVVTLDAYVQGSITDEFQYRLTLSGGASGQFKVNDLTKISKPGGVQLLEPPLAGPVNRVRFSFDAADLGWDGITPISYVWETQKGTGGKKATGFVDETDPLIVEP